MPQLCGLLENLIGVLSRMSQWQFRPRKRRNHYPIYIQSTADRYVTGRAPGRTITIRVDQDDQTAFSLLTAPKLGKWRQQLLAQNQGVDLSGPYPNFQIMRAATRCLPQ